MPGTRSTRTRRTLFRSCRLTAEELALLKDHARRCGMPTSRFLREVALGREPEVIEGAESRELIYHLSRIGNNLNQLDRLARAQGQAELCRQLELTLAELRAAMRRTVP